MTYTLKYFNKKLIEFNFISTPLKGTTIEIVKVFNENRQFLPLNMELDNRSLLSWIKGRTIPKNRAFVYKILMELNLNFDDIEGIISISKSLSINDYYWIVEESFNGLFCILHYDHKE